MAGISGDKYSLSFECRCCDDEIRIVMRMPPSTTIHPEISRSHQDRATDGKDVTRADRPEKVRQLMRCVGGLQATDDFVDGHFRKRESLVFDRYCRAFARTCESFRFSTSDRMSVSSMDSSMFTGDAE